MAEFDCKEYARQMRENAVKDDNGVIRCSPELWEQIASIIENSEEVKHGEWKKIECGTICTNCNRVYDNDFEFSYKQINEYFKRCPECGAKMDVSKMERATERKDK